MPTSDHSTPEHRGKILIEWNFPEYTKHERGMLWYILIIGIGTLLLVYAIRDGNFLFALIILLFAVILFTHHRSEPMSVPFIIYETGMQIGDRFFLFREIESFSIIYEPPQVKRLYIVPKKAILRRELSIPLFEHDPVKLRALLLDFIDEDLDRQEESEADKAARLFKI